jgi:hypothetical protein
MKKIIMLFFLASWFTVNAQVSINTDGSTPDGSAMLEVKSTTKGMLIPRMTVAERNNISLPATGLLVYQVDANAGFYYYTGAAWQYLPASVSISSIQDANGDTKVQVEKNPNEDIIRFDIGGTETMTLTGSRLELKSPLFNINIGENSGTSDSSGTRNTAVGYQTLMYNKWGYDNAAFGFEALRSNMTYCNTAFGSYALRANGVGLNNTAAGYRALMSNQGGNENTAVGSDALRSNIGSWNTASGANALKSNTSGNYNTAFGRFALFSNKGNDRSTAIGHGAMHYADDRTTGWETLNTAVGYEALQGSTTPSANTGMYNTAIGDRALWFNTSGYCNMAGGCQTLAYNKTGNRNTANGCYALYSNENGENNVALGYNAGGLLQSDNNTILGSRAGLVIDDGSNNIMLGYQAGDNVTSGSNNIIIGYDINAPSATASNQVVIGAADLFYGDLANKRIGIGTTTPEGQLHGKNDGDVLFILEADADNNTGGEDDNPRLELRQDMQAVAGALGFIGSADAIYNNSIANSLYLVNEYSSSLQFGTDNTIRMTIRDDGKVGIGTSAPSNTLHVSGSARITSLLANGTVYANNQVLTTTNPSDMRLKENITGFPGTLDKVLNLNPVTFTWKSDGRKGIGFVAQEVERVIPELVNTNEDGYKGIYSTEMIPYLVKAMQEQQEMIGKLQQEIDALEIRNN